MNTQPSSIDTQFARRLRQTVLSMVRIIENPDSTREETRRACSTIKDAFQIHETPGQYGSSVEMRPINRTVDHAGAKLDSQERAFWEKLQQLMRSKSITQTKLAASLGLSQPAISQLLNRKCRPQRNTITSLAAALSVDPRELWPELEVTDILDTVAAFQVDQALSAAEADAFQRATSGPPANDFAARLPERKRK